MPGCRGLSLSLSFACSRERERELGLDLSLSRPRLCRRAGAHGAFSAVERRWRRREELEGNVGYFSGLSAGHC